MSESDTTRQERLKQELLHSGESLPAEFLRLANAVWNDRDTPLSHQECLAALPEFVSAELEGRDVASLFPLVKAHLNRCDECAEQYAELLELSIAEADDVIGKPTTTPQFDFSFRSSPPIRNLKPESWRAKLPDLVAQLQNLILTPHVALAARAATPEIERGQTQDGAMRWLATEDDQQNLVVYIASSDLELEGLPLRAIAGDWTEDTVLTRVMPDQVGTKIVLPPAQRARQPGDTTLRIEIPADTENKT